MIREDGQSHWFSYRALDNATPLSFQSEQVSQPEGEMMERTIIAGPCDIHSEQMDVDHYWIGIRPAGLTHDETTVAIGTDPELGVAITCETAGLMTPSTPSARQSVQNT